MKYFLIEKIPSRHLMLIISMSLFISCGGQQGSRPDALVRKTPWNMWDNPRAIAVCVVNPSQVDKGLRDDVRLHVTRDFHAKTAVRFVGWGDCRSSDYSRNNLFDCLGNYF